MLFPQQQIQKQQAALSNIPVQTYITASPPRDEIPTVQPTLQLDGVPLPLLLDAVSDTHLEISPQQSAKQIHSGDVALVPFEQQQSISKYIPQPPATCHGGGQYGDNLKSTLNDFIHKISREASVATTGRSISSRHRRAKRNAKRLLKRGRRVVRHVGEMLVREG